MKKYILLAAIGLSVLCAGSTMAATNQLPSKSDANNQSGWVAFGGASIDRAVLGGAVSPEMGVGYQFNRYFQVNLAGGYTNVFGQHFGRLDVTAEGLLPLSNWFSLLAEAGVGYQQNFTNHWGRFYVPVAVGARFNLTSSLYSELKLGSSLVYDSDAGKKTVYVDPRLSLLVGYRF